MIPERRPPFQASSTNRGHRDSSHQIPFLSSEACPDATFLTMENPSPFFSREYGFNLVIPPTTRGQNFFFRGRGTFFFVLTSEARGLFCRELHFFPKRAFLVASSPWGVLFQLAWILTVGDFFLFGRQRMSLPLSPDEEKDPSDLSFSRRRRPPESLSPERRGTKGPYGERTFAQPLRVLTPFGSFFAEEAGIIQVVMPVENKNVVGASPISDLRLGASKVDRMIYCSEHFSRAVLFCNVHPFLAVFDGAGRVPLQGPQS